MQLMIEEIEKRYADEWVIIEETDWDERGEPAKDIVIAHSVDRDALTQPTHQFRQRKPEAITYTFYTGEPIPEGVIAPKIVSVAEFDLAWLEMNEFYALIQAK